MIFIMLIISKLIQNWKNLMYYLVQICSKLKTNMNSQNMGYIKLELFIILK